MPGHCATHQETPCRPSTDAARQRPRPHVRDYVLAAPGADRLVERSFNRALALLALPDPHRVDVHVLCSGGRHRSVVVAEELADLNRAVGYGVGTEHRHIDLPILGSRNSPTNKLASLRLLTRGHTHTQIAAILRVSPKTAGRLLYGARLSLRARTDTPARCRHRL